jgi:hypothetical protein
MRFLLGSLALALTVGAGAHAGVSRGTITGVVMRGPIVPVCVAEQPCDAPARAVTLVFVRNGAVAARALTNDQGRYRVRLRAGPYTVRRAHATAPDFRLDPNTVRVFAARVVQVDFSIDTGIR